MASKANSFLSGRMSNRSDLNFVLVRGYDVLADALKYAGNTLPATNAHGHQGVTALGAFRFINGLGGDGGAGGTHWMTQ